MGSDEEFCAAIAPLGAGRLPNAERFRGSRPSRTTPRLVPTRARARGSRCARRGVPAAENLALDWLASMAANSEIEVLAQELSNLAAKVLALEKRMTEVEAVIERLESAAATTARALEEVSAHWDAVYRAMRRAE
jgi:outer membrane murein-binding lipoprotein Lpp